MSDSRIKDRFRKRLQIKFGPEFPEKMAYSGDVSEDGLFIRTVVAKYVHGHMQVEITTPEGEVVILEGQVRWAKRVPAQMVHKHPRAGFGLQITRFLSGEDIYRRLVEEWGTEKP